VLATEAAVLVALLMTVSGPGQTTRPRGITTFGTAIAAFRTPAMAVIAVDSRVVDSGGMQKPEECKIHVVGDTVFAAHGVLKNTKTRFDAIKLIHAEALQPGSLAPVAAGLARSLSWPLAKALDDLRKTEPAAFARSTANAALGVVAARLVEGTPQLAHVRLIARSGAGKKVLIESESHVCPTDCSVGARDATAIWISPRATHAFQNAHPQWWTEDIPAVAVAFVQGEINGGLPEVGAPIDSVQLLAGGQMVWVRRGSCAK
jgi:hypothetical protein